MLFMSKFSTNKKYFFQICDRRTLIQDLALEFSLVEKLRIWLHPFFNQPINDVCQSCHKTHLHHPNSSFTSFTFLNNNASRRGRCPLLRPAAFTIPFAIILRHWDHWWLATKQFNMYVYECWCEECVKRAPTLYKRTIFSWCGGCISKFR